MQPMAATLLVVEDDDDVRDLAVNVLRDEGYRVLQAANGGVAMVMLDQDLPIDLLFTDVVMPGGPDGFELADLAKRRRPELKVLYTTGYSGLARASGDIALHGKILSKPYRPAEITREVRELLSAE
jgi:CheY-like chemotaxis protein